MPNPAVDSHLSSENPYLQQAWDATSLAAFRRCPRYYQYTILEGRTGKGSNVHLTFGIIYHEALEEFDHAIARGMDWKSATRRAVRKAMTASGERVMAEQCQNCKRHWSFKDDTPILPDCPYCGEAKVERKEIFVPWESDHAKNRFSLVRSVVWYCDHFRDDAAETVKLEDGRPAVELSFRLELPATTPSGEPYLLCGHIDKVVKLGNELQFMDRKTTGSQISSRFFEGFNPDTQFSCYSVAMQVIFETKNVSGIIDAVQVAKTFSRFGRGLSSRTKGQIDEWLHDTIYWIKQAETCAQNGYWPMNDQACKLYGGCQFAGVCGMDPGSRHLALKDDFALRDPWNPLRNRGE